MLLVEREIVDLLLIANECLENKIREGAVGIFVKLDVEMVFDHVNWDSLLHLGDTDVERGGVRGLGIAFW